MSTYLELEAGLFDLVDELQAAHPELNKPPRRVWGKTHVATPPAIWLELQPESQVRDDNSTNCAIADELRVAIRIAVSPAAEGTGQDARTIGTYVDPVLGLVDRAMNESRTRFGNGVYLARRLRFYIELVRVGEAQLQTLVLPLLLEWQHDTPTA
jgi:hypothetical protein